MNQPFRTDPADRLRAGLDDPAFDRDISTAALLTGVDQRRRTLLRKRQRLVVATAAAAAALVVGGVAVITNGTPEVTPAHQPVVAPAPASMDPTSTTPPTDPAQATAAELQRILEEQRKARQAAEEAERRISEQLREARQAAEEAERQRKLEEQHEAARQAAEEAERRKQAEAPDR